MPHQRVAGREFAGVVEATPPGGPVIGTLVSGDGYVTCAACHPCRAGNWPLCPRADRLGRERNGGSAQYVALPVRNMWAHPPGTDAGTVVLFDPLGTAVRALTATPVVAQDVLVTDPCGRLPADTLASHGVGEFFACVVETSGDPTVIRLALDRVRPGGHVAAIGIATGPVEIDWNRIV